MINSKFFFVFLLAVNGMILAQINSLSYPIVDTGLKLCYDDSTQAITPPNEGEAYYGQDAQIDGYLPDYTISEDGLTVLDNVTGLTWMKTPETNNDGVFNSYDQLSWDEFLAFPDTLNAMNYGGYNDWRIPSIKEMYSLIDFSGTDPSGIANEQLKPFIDTDYFDFVYGDTTAGERVIDAQYWSSAVYGGYVFVNQIAVFGVNFADGRIKGYPRDSFGNDNSVHYVRLVRGNENYGINDFEVNNDGTVSDYATGLMWTQDDFANTDDGGPRSGYSWREALGLVAELNSNNYLGHIDWRLPNAKELQSIVDYNRSPDATGSAAIDPVFNITEIINENSETDYPWFWSSTTHIKNNGMGDAGAYLTFGRATGYMFNDWIDVHGAGAQRSDRKGNDFSQYTYVNNGYYFSMAPQGDAVRILNYVRPVRDMSITSLDEDGQGSITPNDFQLFQNYPNPFNPSTTFKFTIPQSANVALKVYNLLGEQVATILDKQLSSGTHTYKWSANNLPSGVYIYTLSAGSFTTTKKLILLK